MNQVDDEKYLQLALDEAHEALEAGDFPVGAVLVVDGEVIGTARNMIRTNSNWSSHAETELVRNHASLIKERNKQGAHLTVYTSLEPCLMCMGTLVLCRLSRIVYACPDPYTGSTHLNRDELAVWYKKVWPEIQQGPMKDESKALLLEFVKRSGDPKWATYESLIKSV